MSNLAERIRAARRVVIEIDHMSFLGTRPSVDEFIRLYRDEARNSAIARTYIDGWVGVRECDLVAGGSEQEVSFDAELFDELIADRVDISDTITRKFIDIVSKKLEEMALLEKNSPAGLSTSKSKNTRK